MAATGVGLAAGQYVAPREIKRSYKTNPWKQAVVNIADLGTMGLASYIPGYEANAKKLRGSDYYETVSQLYNEDGTPVVAPKAAVKSKAPAWYQSPASVAMLGGAVGARRSR